MFFWKRNKTKSGNNWMYYSQADIDIPPKDYITT